MNPQNAAAQINQGVQTAHGLAGLLLLALVFAFILHYMGFGFVVAGRVGVG